MSEFLVVAFYKFIPLPHYKELREVLLDFCVERDLLGSILLAKEGINSTISGKEEKLNEFLNFLRNMPEFADLAHKESWFHEKPFSRMKVRLKKEIVRLDQGDIDVINNIGDYAEGDDWNALLEDPDIKVIDTRNTYEISIGTFKNAINPRTKGFTQFAKWVEENLDPKVDKKVGMFCTGGIRCEKASAYMREKGFEEVIQLKGGILKYLEDQPEEKSLWQGDCFVFDHRVAVSHGLVPGDWIMCPNCGHGVDAKGRETNSFEEGISCPNCIDGLTENRRRKYEARLKLKRLEDKRLKKLG